jgi:hypothetical protein
MRTFKGFILASVISLCFVIISCDNQKEPKSNAKQSDHHVVVDPIETDAKADAELRNKLHPLLSEVGIMQFPNGEMESIAFFEDIKQLDHPRTFNIDTSHVQVYIQIQRSDLEQFLTLQSTIQVKGDANYKLTEHDDFPGADWTRVHLDITNIRSSVQLVLGAVPTIELVDLNHDLAYDIVTDKLQYPYIVLNSFLHSGLLLASQEEDQINFKFTDTIDQVNSLVTANGVSKEEWVGEQEYNITFSEEPLMQVSFDQVYAMDGANISRATPTIHYVRWMPKSEWYVYPDNKKIGFSPRDRFYDFLLRSPSPDQYVGLIDPTLAINDGESHNHTLFLERKNQEPYLISSGIGSEFPIISGQWIDNHIFLYWTAKDITIMHTDTLEQEVLFEQQASEGRIYSVLYDPDEHNLIIIVTVQTIGTDTYTLDIWQSSHLSVPVKLNIPSNQFVYNSFDNYHQLVLAYNKGMLFTGAEDLNPVTLYRNEHQREYKASGRLLMLNGDYAILQKLIKGEERYVSWNLRSIEKEPAIIPKAPGNVRVFGSHLISAAFTNNSTREKQYYEYAAASNTWKLSTLTNVQPYLKYQSLDAIYRSE